MCEALHVNSSVEKLYLINNQMGEDGYAAIVAMLERNSCIQLIHMDDNLLSPASKQTLLELAIKKGIRIDV